MRKTIAFNATKHFIMFFSYFCRFGFCHATFDFRDVGALDNFFRRLCRTGFDQSFCSCLVSDFAKALASMQFLLKIAIVSGP